MRSVYRAHARHACAVYTGHCALTMLRMRPDLSSLLTFYLWPSHSAADLTFSPLIDPVRFLRHSRSHILKLYQVTVKLVRDILENRHGAHLPASFSPMKFMIVPKLVAQNI